MPLVLNNTGNIPISVGNIEVNATDVHGETDPDTALYAGNFSIGTTTSTLKPECSQTNMSRFAFVSINNAELPRGNHSVNDGHTGQEQLYYCLRVVGAETSAQKYSTTQDGLWIIKVISLLGISFRLCFKVKREFCTGFKELSSFRRT